jgi:multiple sugar transport system substrate-binding protein
VEAPQTTAPTAQPIQATAAAPSTVSLNLWRFFNECSEKWADVKTLSEDARDVCAINEVMANTFMAANPNIQIATTVTDWPGTIELNAALAAGTPPDIMSMHDKRVPLYAQRGALTPLTAYFKEAGIDVNDILPEVREAVSYNGEIYGLPIDVHGLLWMINMDMWKEAGLVDANGDPILPTNLDEFNAACEKMKKVTDLPILNKEPGLVGITYFWYGLLGQFGGTVVDAEGKPNVNTPEALSAVNLMLEVAKSGCAPFNDNPSEGFFKGISPGNVEGTWMVNEFDAVVANPNSGSALKNFYVATMPKLGPKDARVWGGSHVWVVPLGAKADPERVKAITKYLKFWFDNQLVWARTGHGTVRDSVLKSDAYQALPHRREYLDFPNQVFSEPGTPWISGFEGIMTEELQQVVFGKKTPEQALAAAQSRLTDLSQFGGN